LLATCYEPVDNEASSEYYQAMEQLSPDLKSLDLTAGVDGELQVVAERALEQYEAGHRVIRQELSRLRELDRQYTNKIQVLRSLLHREDEPSGAVSGMVSIGEDRQSIDEAIAKALEAIPPAERNSQEAIWTAAAAALQTNGPMHYQALFEVLTPHVTLGGQNPASTLLSYLSRRAERFNRVARGTYALVDIPPAPSGTVVRPRRKRRIVRRRRKNAAA
jgi:hypothetical protein